MSNLDIPEFLKRPRDNEGWKDFPVPDRQSLSATSYTMGHAGFSHTEVDGRNAGLTPATGVKKRFPKEKFKARKALAEGARWDARNNKWVHDSKPVYAHADSVKLDGKNWFEWAR